MSANPNSPVANGVKFALRGGVNRVHERRRKRMERMLKPQTPKGPAERARLAAKLAIDSIFADHGELGLETLKDLLGEGPAKC